jgi:O-antigen/teichoic acid export membrane protein
MTSLRPPTASAPDAVASLRQRLVRGSGWVFGGKVVGSMLALGTNAFLARLLVPHQLGVYFIGFTTAMIGGTIGTGFGFAVVRFVAASLATERPARARAAIRLAVRGAALGVLAMVIVLGVTLGPTLEWQFGAASATTAVVVLIVAWAAAVAFQTLIAETFRGFHDFRLATAFDGLVTNVLAVTLLTAVWLAGVSMTLTRALLISVAATVVATAVSATTLRRRVATLPRGGHLQRRELMTVAWPLWVFSAFTFLLGTGIDIWIVGALDGATNAALYGAASRLVLFVATPLIIVSQVVLPIVAQLHAQDRPRQMERTLRDVATVAGIPACGVLLVFLVAGGPILALVYGPPYRGAATVLAVLSFARLFAVYAGTCGVALMMTGHQRTMMTITIISGLLSVSLGLLLGLQFGMVGVAVGTAAGQIFQNLTQLLWAHRRLGIWTHARLSLRPVRQLVSPAR